MSEEKETTIEVKPSAGKDDNPLTASKFKLFMYVFALGLGALQTGWAITGNTQTAPVFIEKFKWDEDEAKLYNTIISSVSIFGIAIGSLLGGKAVQKGRRRAIFIFNGVVIVGALICQYLSVTSLCIGRFVCGIAAGVLNVCLSKSCYETVPEHLSGMFGSLTNFYIAFGVMLATVSGAVLPHEEQHYENNETWRFVYACPVIIGLAQVILTAFVWKEEPILYAVSNNRDEEAKRLVAKVFYFPKENTEAEKQVAY